MKQLLLIALTLFVLSAHAKDEKPPAPPPEPTHAAVPINVMNAILQSLQTRPYAEVAQLIEAYRQTAQLITLGEPETNGVKRR